MGPPKTIYYTEHAHRLLHTISNEICSVCEMDQGCPPVDKWKVRFAVSGAVMLASALGMRDPDQTWRVAIEIGKAAWGRGPEPKFGKRQPPTQTCSSLVSMALWELAQDGVSQSDSVISDRDERVPFNSVKYKAN